MLGYKRMSSWKVSMWTQYKGKNLIFVVLPRNVYIGCFFLLTPASLEIRNTIDWTPCIFP